MMFTDRIRIETAADLDREFPQLVGRIKASRLDEPTKGALVSLAKDSLEPFRAQLQTGLTPMSGRRVISGNAYRLIIEIGPKRSPLGFLGRLIGR